MMGSASNGATTAADLVLSAMGRPSSPEPEPEQLDVEDFLGLPRGVIPTGEPLPGAPRRPGRPPGSRNRRTVQWVEFLLSRYASPLEVLAQMATARVEDLQKQLGCNALEAFQEKRHAAIALAPFLHQRQPIAVNISERKVIYLTIEASNGDGRVIDGDSVRLEAQVLTNQGHSASEPAMVGRDDVGREPQPIDTQGELPAVPED